MAMISKIESLQQESASDLVVTRRGGKVSTIQEYVLPGEGMSGDTCGLKTGGIWFCKGCGYVIEKRRECGSAECPSCRRLWLTKQTNIVKEKMEWATDYLGNPRHFSINPSDDWWEMPEREMRAKVFRQVGSRKGGPRWLGGEYDGQWIGLKGGFATFHPFRWYRLDNGERVRWRWNAENPDAKFNLMKDRAEYLENMSSWPIWREIPPVEAIPTVRYYSPHYHVVAWGAMPKVTLLMEHKGIGYVNHDGTDSRGRGEIGGTVWYALSHCGIEPSDDIEEVVYTDARTGLERLGRRRSRKQAYWWFGIMGNACVSVEKYRMKEVKLCPECGGEMEYQTIDPFYEGDGVHIMVTKRHYKFKPNALATLEDWMI
jgi:hypothetical protein